jgi:protein gp37
VTVFPPKVFKMFQFITCTWNPLGGECKHNCVYCWARKLAVDRKLAKYQGEPHLIEKELRRQFRDGEFDFDFVFVCDMLDLFGNWVPTKMIAEVVKVVNKFEWTKFLFLTKNPARYWQVETELCLQEPPIFIRGDVYFGATIESNRDYDLSLAPPQSERLKEFYDVVCNHANRAFISVEPILDFDVDEFSRKIINIEPWAVAVGYDNYTNHLSEPSLAKTIQLIERLEKAGITVYRKTLREAWNK